MVQLIKIWLLLQKRHARTQEDPLFMHSFLSAHYLYMLKLTAHRDILWSLAYDLFIPI